MADISKLKLPNDSSVYNIKDATARNSINGLSPVASSGSYNDLTDKPTIPPAYTLPVASANLGGVKSGTDITVDSNGNVSVNDDSHNHIISNVDGLQTALDSKGTYSKPSGGIPKDDLATSVQTSLGLADTALQSYTETDPNVPSWAKQTNPPAKINSYSSFTSNANIYVGNTAPASVSTSGWAIGTLYVYVKP